MSRRERAVEREAQRIENSTLIWTTRDWIKGCHEASRRRDMAALHTLRLHYYHSDHCGGYDVAAWPCPIAAEVLFDLICLPFDKTTPTTKRPESGEARA